MSDPIIKLETPHPAIKRWARLGNKSLFLGDRNELCDCRPRDHTHRWVVFAHILEDGDLPPICPHWRIPNWEGAEAFELNTDDEAEAVEAFNRWEAWVRT